MSFNERSYANYGSQFGVQVGTSGSYTAINGLNIGAPAASGVTVEFTIPASFEDGCVLFTVAAAGGNANGTVIVSGLSSNTVNGGTSALTISDKTSKQLYNLSGTDWRSF